MMWSYPSNYFDSSVWERLRGQFQNTASVSFLAACLVFKLYDRTFVGGGINSKCMVGVKQTQQIIFFFFSFMCLYSTRQTSSNFIIHNTSSRVSFHKKKVSKSTAESWFKGTVLCKMYFFFTFLSCCNVIPSSKIHLECCLDSFMRNLMSCGKTPSRCRSSSGLQFPSFRLF